MGCHLIALGGTGQKVLEMITYACACDALYSLDDDLRHKPINTLSVLTVDTDSSATTDITEPYQTLRSAFSEVASPRSGFHTQLIHAHLPIVGDEHKTIQSVANGQDTLLTQSLFTLRKSALDASDGLRGHADIGMFFFAHTLSHLDDVSYYGSAVNAFFDRIQAELDQQEPVHVLLVGSVYGGTGMSGIPSMARYLRKRYPSRSLVLGATMLLPPHDPRNTDRYNSRAAVSLTQYGYDGIMRRNAYDTEGLLDAAYPIKMRENLYAATYAQTMGSQESDFRVKDWIAVHCASQFFSTSFRAEETESIGVYHTPRTSQFHAWQCFDDDRAFYRMRFGGFLRAAALHFTECKEALEDALQGKTRLAHSVQPYCKNLKKFPLQAKEDLLALLHTWDTFLMRYITRMREVQTFLPPPTPGKPDTEGLFDLQALQALYRCTEATQEANKDALQRQIREKLPTLVPNDPTTAFSLKRAMAGLSKGKKPADATPEAVLSAYITALLACAITADDRLPAAQLPLPHSKGMNPNNSLLTLARNVPLSRNAPFCDAPDIMARELRLCRVLSLPYAQTVQVQDVIEWRGLITILLLWDSWEMRYKLPALQCETLMEGEAAKAIQAAMPKARLPKQCTVFSLQKDVDGILFEGALGILSYQTGLLSAGNLQKLQPILPDCVRWYQQDTNAWIDPCPLLNETDKARLVHRLQCLQALIERPELKSPLHQSGGALYMAADAYLGDLQSRHEFWRERFEQDDPRAIQALYIRTLAVYGPPMQGIHQQDDTLSLHDLKQNPLLLRLLGNVDSKANGLSQATLFSSEPMTSYSYHGKPFAVDSTRYLLTPVHIEGEQDTLDQLLAVIQSMTAPAYHQQAAKRFLALANRLTSRAGASRKVVSLLRAWSVRHSRMAEEALHSAH